MLVIVIGSTMWSLTKVNISERFATAELECLLCNSGLWYVRIVRLLEYEKSKYSETLTLWLQIMV